MRGRMIGWFLLQEFVESFFSQPQLVLQVVDLRFQRIRLTLNADIARLDSYLWSIPCSRVPALRFIAEMGTA